MLYRLILATLSLCISSSIARADMVLTIMESGPHVYVFGDGTIDLNGLSADGFGTTDQPGMQPGVGVLLTGGVAAAPNSSDLYNGISGPANFGSGGTTLADAASGDFFGFNSLANDLYVPSGFASGGSLSVSNTYFDTDLATLGVTEGTYVWTWAGGSVTVHAVPEPSTYALLAFASLGGLAYVWRKKRNVAASDQTG